jgi:hypothetical protein
VFQGPLDKPLSIINPGDGKGLTRGATATSAYSGQNYSYLSSPRRPGFLQSIGNYFKSSTLFGAFFTIGQPTGTTYKGDDQTYSLMINNKRIVSFNKSGDNTYGTLGVVQRFSPDDRDLEGTPTYDKYSRYVGQYNSSILKYSAQSLYIDINSYKLSEGVIFFGAGNKTYFSGIDVLNPGYEVSDILFLYNDYLTNNNYPTKLKSTRKIDSIVHTLDAKKVYTIQTGGYIKDTGILDTNGKPVKDSPIITNQYDKYIDPTKTDVDYPTKLTSLDGTLATDGLYNRTQLDQIKHNPSGQGYVIDPNTSVKGYENRNVNPQTKEPFGAIKNDFELFYTQDVVGEYPTTFIKGENDFGQEQIDFANQQNQSLTEILKSNYTFVPPTELNKVRNIIDSDADVKKNTLSYLAKYRNYRKVDLLDEPDGKGFAGVNKSDLINVLNVQTDTNSFINKDLIKFYFYDVYNQKYIPFRATVKNVSERSVSTWDDFQYVGNADKVYNYKGFTRALSFGFTVVAMSVQEMLPMWQRINYLMGLSKPANYKNGFIVPPLVMVTIGDIYKDQPVVINSIGMTIPDNATWETISDSTNIFEYLNGRLTTNGDVTLAQFPREAEINIDANILEKEMPKVGVNNFGDAFNFGKFSYGLYVNNP